ncbi:MAG: glycerol-3-phosphate acyltransferase, partial [Clostridia bacterium]|nr:glycerol-3-phosphate acyltransferase [Clostridia bacterium]
HGSGNTGTTNTLRVLGAKAGAVALFGDILKTTAACLICWGIFSRRNSSTAKGYTTI